MTTPACSALCLFRPPPSPPSPRKSTETGCPRSHNAQTLANAVVDCGLGLPHNIMRIMTTAAVSQLLYLLDEAFQGTDWHSLLTNLRSLTPEDWTWVPPAGRRSIRDIVQHVGGCKFMYHNHAFGDARLTWDDPLVDGGDA